MVSIQWSQSAWFPRTNQQISHSLISSWWFRLAFFWHVHLEIFLQLTFWTKSMYWCVDCFKIESAGTKQHLNVNTALPSSLVHSVCGPRSSGIAAVRWGGCLSAASFMHTYWPLTRMVNLRFLSILSVHPWHVLCLQNSLWQWVCIFKFIIL